MRSKRNPRALLVGMQAGAFPLWKTVWNFLGKLKMELSFDLAMALLGLYPKNLETLIQKNLCTPMFIAISSNPLYFCGISCNLSYFISDFIFGSFPIFLDESG